MVTEKLVHVIPTILGKGKLLVVVAPLENVWVVVKVLAPLGASVGR